MAPLKSPRDDRYGRLESGQPVRTLYRVVHDRDGSVRALYRIVWQGNDFAWNFGDGYFANAKTGWQWCPAREAQMMSHGPKLGEGYDRKVR